MDKKNGYISVVLSHKSQEKWVDAMDKSGNWCLGKIIKVKTLENNG